MMELTEDLLKLIQIALIVVGVLALYFSFINYNIIIDSRSAERESIVLGNALLSSDCLTYSGIKSLFSENSLNNAQANPSCLKKYYPQGDITVNAGGRQWRIEIAPATSGIESSLNVAIRMSSGSVGMGTMTVKV